MSLNAQWIRTYGGSGSEYAKLVQQTRDGGFIIAGQTNSSQSRTTSDVWVLKLNIDGNIEWQKIYYANLDSILLSICQTNNGGYILSGYVHFYSQERLWVIELNSSGDIVSDKIRGISQDYFTSSIQQTADGGFILTGYFYSKGEDVWILKLTQAWDTEWQRAYGGVYNERVGSIQQTNDGGYILAGSTLSFGAGGEDIWVLKLSCTGDIEWQRAYGGIEDDNAYSVQETSDGGFIIGSNTKSFDAGQNYFLILKLTESGDVEWQKTYGAGLNENANAVNQSNDGGYIVAGSISAFGTGSSDFWVLKLLQNGNTNLPCRFIKKAIVQIADTYVIPEGINLSLGDSNFYFLITYPPIQGLSQEDSHAAVYELCSLKPLITIRTTLGGTTDPSPGNYTYNSGEEVSITAIPDNNAQFMGWNGDASGTSNPMKINLDSDKSITAIFIS